MICKKQLRKVINWKPQPEKLPVYKKQYRKNYQEHCIHLLYNQLMLKKGNLQIKLTSLIIHKLELLPSFDSHFNYT